MDGGNVIFNFEGNDSKLKSMVSSIGDDISKMAKTALVSITALGTAAASAVAVSGIKFNSEMEQYQAGLKTLLGSADEANKMLSDLK